ncbi:MAG TPA: MCE family protein [Acidimicrobiales bacterium]|nr:MCE family protein [Acidimicrobiales bacterium]
MITRRIVANLVSFVVLSTALVAYGFLDLLGNPLSSPATVSTVLPSASGLSPNFTVTLDGVDVGSVKSVSLVPGGAKVTMTLNPGTTVPADVAARVTIANALGQQEVELVPAQVGPGPSLRNGAVIPAAADSLPADVGTVVAEATKLLQSIPAGDFNTVVHELALALNGNGANLRTIASASALFSEEFLAYQQQFEALLANSPPVLDAVTANAVQLQQGLADTAVLAKVLASRAPDLVRLLNQGPSAAADLQALVVQNEPNLACLVHDLSDVNANLAASPNLSNFSTTLATNQQFFGAVAAVAPIGPAKALTSGDKARNDQEWLRTRLLLPPQLPPGDSYVQALTLPAVLPGAACSTEFGQGAGAGVQADFRPAGPNAHVVAPSGSDAHVRGGGTATVSGAPAAARLPLSPAGSGVAVFPTLAGLGVLVWVLTMGRRRPQRSARAVRIDEGDRRRTDR